VRAAKDACGSNPAGVPHRYLEACTLADQLRSGEPLITPVSASSISAAFTRLLTFSALANPSLRAEPTPRFFGPRFSVQQSLPSQPRTTIIGGPRTLTNDIVIDAFDFFLPVQYDLDKRLLNGHVIFKRIKHSKAVIKTCHVDLHHGTELTGHDKLTIQTEQGLLVIDCASVEQPPTSYMERCGTTGDERCFHLVFGSAILYPPVGDPIEGSAEVITSCDPDDVENEEGSCPDFGGGD